jgi:hypothetical protein
MHSGDSMLTWRGLVAVTLAVAAVLILTAAPAASAKEGRTVAVTAQGSGYSIPTPPGKTVGNALLRTTAETIQNVGNMIAGVGVAGLTANGLASLGIITLPETVPGAAVSGIVLGAGLGISFVGGFLKNYFTDPVDFHFKKVAKPQRIRLPAYTAASPALKQIALDEHSLNSAAVDVYALAQAFHTSVDRAHGALVRHNHLWEGRQLGAAVRYAHASRPEFDRLAGLQVRLTNDFNALGLAFVVGNSGIERNDRNLAAKLPSGLTGLLRQFGLSRFANRIRRVLRSAKAPAYGLEFPEVLSDPALLNEERRTATLLGRETRRRVVALITA